ncbi:MAG: hypothetical protein KDC83_10790 [Flavobacteriales bacterium]|nr:hypothetical protein [Flavobacteriales bacterium]
MEIKRLTIHLKSYSDNTAFSKIIVQRDGVYLVSVLPWGDMESDLPKLVAPRRSADEILRYAESLRIKRKSLTIENPEVQDGAEVSFLFEYDLARPVHFVLVNSFTPDLLAVAVFVCKRIKEGKVIVDFLSHWKKVANNRNKLLDN